jgi:hypothetical protein
MRMQGAMASDSKHDMSDPKDMLQAYDPAPWQMARIADSNWKPPLVLVPSTQCCAGSVIVNEQRLESRHP